MVTTRAKKWSTFSIFVLPALILYTTFAIVPLFMGTWLSTTNWDGVGPWVPVQIPIEEFEDEIMPRLNDRQQEFISGFYIKDVGQGTYRKQETNDNNLRGLRKYRAMRIFALGGYENESFRFVGFENYRSVFSVESDPAFWPRTVQMYRFKKGDPLSKAATIDVKEFENNLIPNISESRDSDLLAQLFSLEDGTYVLDYSHFPRKGQKFTIAGELIELPDVGDEWEPFLDAVEDAGLDGEVLDLSDIRSIAQRTVTAVADGSISPESMDALERGGTEVFEAATLKRVLSENWFVNSRRMGVLLFTLFFGVTNVIIVNVFALLIALALDQKLKSRNALRSLFFIPNVLSMVVVAFIWQLIFSHVFPIITGVSRWLSNPDAAPWLSVVVASWQGMGYYMIVYLAGLQNVPQEILESASIDGASGFKKFWGIILPMLVPAFTIALFLSISGSLKTFDIIFALFPSTTRNMGVENIAINIYRNAFVDRQAGLANAKAILMMLVIAMITFFQLRLTKKREVEM